MKTRQQRTHTQTTTEAMNARTIEMFHMLNTPEPSAGARMHHAATLVPTVMGDAVMRAAVRRAVESNQIVVQTGADR